jgi:chromate reductase, NAD(P)H dehydrogenase (quinone)
MKKLTILAISGSLKSSSSNTRILKNLQKLNEETMTIDLYMDLDELPHFNPEKESGTPAVQRFRQLLKEADGVILSTPEYAFGVPGVLKNALDWVVSSGELNEKPVVAISASPMYEGGSKAMASLLLTLSALGTKMSAGSSLSVPNILKKINERGEIIDEDLLRQLKQLLDHLQTTISNSNS